MRLVALQMAIFGKWAEQERSNWGHLEEVKMPGFSKHLGQFWTRTIDVYIAESHREWVCSSGPYRILGWLWYFTALALLLIITNFNFLDKLQCHLRLTGQIQWYERINYAALQCLASCPGVHEVFVVQLFEVPLALHSHQLLPAQFLCVSPPLISRSLCLYHHKEVPSNHVLAPGVWRYGVTLWLGHIKSYLALRRFSLIVRLGPLRSINLKSIYRLVHMWSRSRSQQFHMCATL